VVARAATGALYVALGALVILLSPIARLDADEAVTGIMAQRILDGDLPVFYAGQNYLGTIEQYLQAVVLAVAPDTAASLRAVQVRSEEHTSELQSRENLV